MRMFGFPLILACILMFYYVIWRLFVIFHNNSKIIPLIIAVVLTIIVMGTFMYSGNSKILDIIGTISSRIFVFCFLLMIILFIENIVSIRYKANPRIVVGVIVLIFGLGTFFSLHTKIKTLNIQSDKIGENVKILLVSDIHAENVTQKFHINKIIKTIDKEKPDFVIIAGDLMNKPNNGYVNYFSAFKSIESTPIFAVIGNHDVMGNVSIVQKIPEVSGIEFLNNESVYINGIKLTGIVDKSLRGNNPIELVMNQLVQKDDSDLFSILISHQPIGLEKLQNYPIDLEVAGHTHHGQFYGMRKVVEWMNDYAYGEYKLGNRTAFVTQGIGTWGLPFRLGTQSEMILINLKKK